MRAAPISLLNARTQRSLLLAAGLAMTTFAATALGGTFNSMVVFGDSLSDTGNVKALNKDRPLKPFYDDGRWTNGSALNGQKKLDLADTKASGVWHEVLARQFGKDKDGKPNVPPAGFSRGGGTNYAYGGATTDARANWGYRDIGFQIKNEFLTSKPTFSDATLYCIWGGGNDIRTAAIEGKKPPLKAATDAVSNLENYIGLLSKEAAKSKTKITVLWPNVPPMQLIPDFADAAAKTVTDLTKASEAFRDQQKVSAKALAKANPNLTLLLFDVFTLFDDVVKEKVDMGKGFDAKTPILDFNGFSDWTFSPEKNKKVASQANPDLFMFWDKVHPTAKVHELIGERAFALIPAPATLWIGAVMAITAARRRRVMCT